MKTALLILTILAALLAFIVLVAAAGTLLIIAELLAQDLWERAGVDDFPYEDDTII